jgi:hypothetical protein
MSVSRCIGLAMNIRRFPRVQWADQIAKIGPCQFDDCTHKAPAETRCQEVAKEYLRTFYRGAK